MLNKKIILMSIPLMMFSTVTIASINDFRPNRDSINAEFKYSKYDLDQFSRELVSLDIQAKMQNNFVLGGEIGVFENNENYFDLSLGYRIHHSRNLFFQGNLGYAKYDFNNTSDEDFNTKYGNIELGYRYTNGMYLRIGAERNFPNNDLNILGLEKGVDYYISGQYNFMNNMYFSVSYRQLFEQYGVGLVWKF